MSKDFNEFMKLMDSKDWSSVVADISKKIENKTPQETMILTNIYTNTILLREYHDWLNKNQ